MEKTDKGPLGKLSTTWSKGIFLGIRGLTGELRVGTAEGIFRTRSTQRVPYLERWNPEASNLVGGVPWMLSGQDQEADGEALRQEPLRPLSEELLEETRVREPVPRSFNITPQDLRDHGYTPKCPGCTAVLSGTARQGHNDACRARLEEAMKDLPKVKAARARVDEYIAERVREEDEKRRRTAEGGPREEPPSTVSPEHIVVMVLMSRRVLKAPSKE